MKTFILVLLFVFIRFNFANADEKAETPTSFTAVISQDPAFGFYPAIYGSIGLSKNTSFTFYGVFWTSPVTGDLRTNNIGMNLLTEFGAGVNFSLLDGSLNINPSFGIANGRYQSGADRPVLADNIVPSVALSYSSGDFVITGGSILWLASRKEGDVQYDLMDYYLNPSYNFSSYVNGGLYYDHLLFSTKTNDKTETVTSYMWIGPSLKLSTKSGASLSFIFGVDLVDYLNDEIIDKDKNIKDFYKLSASLPF